MNSQVQVTFTGIDATNNDFVNTLLNDVTVNFNYGQLSYSTPDNTTLVIIMEEVN